MTNDHSGTPARRSGPAGRRDAARRNGRGAGAVLLAGLAGFAGLAVGGCKPGQASASQSDDQHQTYQHEADRVEVDLDSGGVTLTGGADGQVTVDRELRWDQDRQRIDERWEGNTLRITVRCVEGDRNCGTDYRIELPGSASVSVRTQAGDLASRGVHGSQELRTTAGEVKVSDGGGPLTLESTSGRIVGTALATDRTEATTVSGRIDLTFTVAPQSVSATSTSGSIGVEVPRGSEGYAVQASTASGRKRVGVTTGGDGQRRIVATTTNGDVRVDYAG